MCVINSQVAECVVRPHDQQHGIIGWSSGLYSHLLCIHGHHKLGSPRDQKYIHFAHVILVVPVDLAGALLSITIEFAI